MPDPAASPGGLPGGPEPSDDEIVWRRVGRRLAEAEELLRAVLLKDGVASIMGRTFERWVADRDAWLAAAAPGVPDARPTFSEAVLAAHCTCRGRNYNDPAGHVPDCPWSDTIRVPRSALIALGMDAGPGVPDTGEGPYRWASGCRSLEDGEPGTCPYDECRRGCAAQPGAEEQEETHGY